MGIRWASVLYGSASELRETLEYDFTQEKKYSYKGLSIEEMIHHLAVFVANLWQIHVFGEGNTRTTAVFFIKYLRTLGFDATNDIFAENAWYFRNALVRANYNDLKNGIHETTEYLEVFLRNLLLNEKNPLHNRMMHINKEFINLLNESLKTEEANIEMKKVNIKREKSNIVTEKVNIDVHDKYSDEIHGFLEKTINHIQKMYDALSDKVAFGREDVQHATGLKPTRASMLIKELVKRKILEPVSGYGKGKYKFTGISVERQYGSWTELL